MAALQLGAVAVSHLLNPRTVLPALFLGPAISLVAGGGLALVATAFGAALVRTALEAF
jgi:hypothetical protein